MKRKMILTCLAAVLMACCALTSCKNGNDDDDDNTPVTTITTSQPQSGGSSGSSGGSGSGSSGGGGSSSSSGTYTVNGYSYMTFDSSGNGSWYFANATGTGYDEMVSGMTYTISGSTIEFSVSGIPVYSAAIISGTSFNLSITGGSAGSGSGSMTSLNGKTYVANFTSDGTTTPDVLTYTEGTTPSHPTTTSN